MSVYRKELRVLSAPMWTMAVLAVSCSLGAVPTSRVVCGICEGPERFVRLQAPAGDRPAASAQQFSHPIRLSAEQWKPILHSIQVQKRGQGPFFFPGPNGPTVPAFTPAEVDYLGETLTRAFAEAQPSEMVVFGLTNRKTPEFGEITTGAWFVKDSKLHLVLVNYREGFTMSNVRDLVWQDPLHMIAAPLYEFVPGPHQSMTREANELWTFLVPEAPQITLAYQPLASDDTSLPDGGVVEGAHPSIRPDSSLEGKLQRLKQVHDRGLITDEEYAAKKKELLDGF